MAAVSSAGTPLPLAVVQPAPAATPEQVAAAQGIASAPPTAGAAPDASGEPAVAKLDVPAEFLARLNKAVVEGAADAVTFAKEHTPAERWMVPDWALLKMAWPPKTDAEDLAYLHKVAATRTPEGIAAAQYWSKHGMVDEWEKLLEEYTSRVGPVQARAARKLLHDALMMVHNVTQTAKAAAGRERPFAVDPTLKLAVDKPGNSPSYPSGHTSAAYAAGLVLSHLMPDRRAEFLGIAQEASWARVYSGVHFPTDVIAGAKIATTVTSYLVKQSMAQPRRGTKDVNTGVAGGRHALPGAVVLAGTPIGPPPAPVGVPRAGHDAGAVMGQGQPGT